MVGQVEQQRHYPAAVLVLPRLPAVIHDQTVRADNRPKMAASFRRGGKEIIGQDNVGRGAADFAGDAGKRLLLQ